MTTLGCPPTRNDSEYFSTLAQQNCFPEINHRTLFYLLPTAIRLRKEFSLSTWIVNMLAIFYREDIIDAKNVPFSLQIIIFFTFKLPYLLVFMTSETSRTFLRKPPLHYLRIVFITLNKTVMCTSRIFLSHLFTLQPPLAANCTEQERNQLCDTIHIFFSVSGGFFLSAN